MAYSEGFFSGLKVKSDLHHSPHGPAPLTALTCATHRTDLRQTLSIDKKGSMQKPGCFAFS